MKHLFIINPVAGKKDSSDFLKAQIAKLKLAEPFFIHFTTGSQDAENTVKEFMTNNPDEFVRIYSCGGDGTLNEVINGAYGFENCAVGDVPVGSGNDFARSIYDGNVADLLEISKTIKGEIKQVDLLECDGRVAINTVSVGYDCAVAKNMARFKRIPLINGSTAYKLSIAYCLISKLRNKFDIKIDDELVIDITSPYLLVAAGNGRYYGGGIQVTPQAVLDDGLIDFVYIDTISIIKFAQLLGDFIEGKHIDNPKMPFIKHTKCKSFQILHSSPVDIGLDGEIFSKTNPIVTVKPGIQKIIVPKL